MTGTVDPARQVALAVLERIERGGGYLQQTLEGEARRAALEPRDRRLALELAMGVTRWRRRLDHALATRLRGGVDGVKPPRLVPVLRMAAYQLLMMDRIPAHAAVSAAVEQARAIAGEGPARFTNGVLRRLADARPDPPGGEALAALAVRESHPDWLIEAIAATHGSAHAAAFCAANNTPAPLTARAIGGDRSDVIARLEAEGAEVTPGRWATGAVHITGHPAPFDGASFREGRWRAQDEASQLVVELLDPAPGERIWDACAAPGGKSLYIAERIGSEGALLATDVHASKVRKMASAFQGWPHARAESRDATLGAPSGAGPFDAVLLDAPCSGLGLLRRHPEIRWRRTPDDVAALADVQRRLLDAVAPSVGPGGRLVYSLCTVTEAEGPAQIEAFLARHPEFAIDPPEDPRWVSLLDGPWLRTWPHVHGSDGFFAARLRREPPSDDPAPDIAVTDPPGETPT